MKRQKQATHIAGPNYYELSDAQAIRENWCNWIGSEPSIEFEKSDFRSVGNAIFLQDLTITEGWTDSAAFSRRPPTHMLTQHFLVDRSYRVDGIDVSDRYPAVLSPPSRQLFKQQPKDIFVMFVMMDQVKMEAHLSRILGGLGAPLQFADPGGSSAEMMLRLRRALFALVVDCNQIGSQLSSIALREMQSMLIFEMLLCNLHNYSSALLSPARDLARSSVLLIETYLEANWDRPFSLDEIVQISGIAPRSIFRSFQKYRGYSPFDFLRSVRLNKSRKFLMEGDPNDGVIAIALRCGFANAGRMAGWYFKMFGELPSDTHRHAVAHSRLRKSLSAPELQTGPRPKTQT